MCSSGLEVLAPGEAVELGPGLGQLAQVVEALGHAEGRLDRVRARVGPRERAEALQGEPPFP